jgi:hypothetical protein
MGKVLLVLKTPAMLCRLLSKEALEITKFISIVLLISSKAIKLELYSLADSGSFFS